MCGGARGLGAGGWLYLGGGQAGGRGAAPPGWLGWLADAGRRPPPPATFRRERASSQCRAPNEERRDEPAGACALCAEAAAEASARSRSRISPAAAASGRWQCPDWESQVYRGREPMYRGRRLVAPLRVGRAELPPQVVSGQDGLVQRRVLLVDASGQRLPEGWRKASGGGGPGDGSEDQRLRLRCVGRHKSSAPR